MGIGAIMKFCRRIAVRNNLYLFAWLCSLVVPWGLHFISSMNEDVMSYLDTFYGTFTLFMFFTMTYGFATIFAAYYILTGMRRAGTLDMLRVTGIAPREIVLGIFWQLQKILVLPMLGFLVSLAFYMSVYEPGGQIAALGLIQLIGGALGIMLNQAILVAVMCNVLYRREHFLALLCMPIVLFLNVSPIVLVYMMHMPMLVFLSLQIALIALALWLASYRLGHLWGPTVVPVEFN